MHRLPSSRPTLACLTDELGRARPELNLDPQVLVRVLKQPQPHAGLVTKPAPTAVMAAWSLGYWARRGANHADAVLFAGELTFSMLHTGVLSWDHTSYS